MNIKPLRIEILFAGITHFLWITLLALCILGESPDIILKFLTKVESGTAVFLFAIIVSVCFFLGTIAENFLIALNYFRKNEKGREKILKLFTGTPGEIWGAKIFFLSSFSGLLIIITLLLLSDKIESFNAKWAIFVVGMILELATFTSFLFWYNLERRKSNLGG
jgi:hypothetical protein